MENNNNSNNTAKARLSWFTVIAAVGFGIAGTWIDPQGEIDGTMLGLIAQLLIFAATMMGFGEVVKEISGLINLIKKKETPTNGAA